MAEIIGKPQWSPVRLLESDEYASGGEDGNMNEQAKALADRTEYLNQEKASKADIVQGHYSFETLEQFEAKKSQIPVNSNVIIDEEGPNQGTNTWDGISLKKSAYDPTLTLQDQQRTREYNRFQNPNKFSVEQVLFSTMPTSITGTASVVTRNGLKQLKLVSAEIGGAIIAYWAFPVEHFTRDFSFSVVIEGLTAGKNGYVGIQQLDSNNGIIDSSYAQTNMVGAVTKQVFKATSQGIVPGAVNIRLIAFMQTDEIREMYVHSPFLADGPNTEFIAPQILQDLNPINQSIGKLNAAFNEIDLTGKNLFYPGRASDGFLVTYSTGQLFPYSTGVALGRHPVEADKTYTLSIPLNSPFSLAALLYTYASDGSFLGIDHSVPSSGEKVNLNPPTNINYSDGYRTVTFTIPVGSNIAFIQLMTVYRAHTTDEYNTLVNGSQLEVGGVRTPFEAYIPGGKKLILRADALPEIKLPPQQNNRETFTVILDGTDAYIRTKFSDTLDQVQQVRYNSNDPWKNNVINPWSIRNISASTAKDATVSAFSIAQIIATQGDDATPLNYNSTYIGANHGAFIVHQVVKSGHGKTYSDVGSKWTDGTRNYTLIRILDVNTLWFVSDNTGTDGAWVFFATKLAAGTTFTHVSGATNTAAIDAITSDTITQLLKALNNHSKKIIANGFMELSTPGIYEVEYLELIDSYDIMNVPAILAYLQARVGTTTEQKFDVDTIASDIRVSVTYSYALNGSITGLTQAQVKKSVKWGWIGLMQALPLNYGGKNLLLYVPKSKPIVVGPNTWDLINISNVTSVQDVISIAKASWLDLNNPPDRFVSIVKNAVNNEFGQVIGHSLTRGITKPATRKSSSEVGFFNGPTKKIYPHSQTGDIYAGSLIPVGTLLNAVSYRSVFNSQLVPEATAFTWFKDNKDYYVVFDIHTNATLLKLPLPKFMNGKMVEIIESNLNFTSHNEMVCDGGILVSANNNYASAMLKIS